MDDTVIYNRGLLQAAIQVEAITQRAQDQRRPEADRPSRSSRASSRSTTSPWAAWCRRCRSPPTDHEGGGWVQIFQVKDGKFVKPRPTGSSAYPRRGRARGQDRRSRPAGSRAAGSPVRVASMLALNNIEVVYDGVILVLRGVSLEAEEGRITTLLGANGAGKTTTLKAISGLLRTERGEVTKGSVELDGARHRPPAAARRRQARRRPGIRGPAGLREPDGRGKPDRRRP